MIFEWEAAEGVSRTIPDSNAPSWDILICSIAERTELLDALLQELNRQRKPGVGVRVFRDNKQTCYGSKCQALVESSKADYICFLDDDDWIAEDYVDSIREALMHKPDYVGFKVLYTNEGQPQVPVYHSTTFGTGWRDEGYNGLYRDINHFNPIKREIALQGLWEGGDGADARWAEQIRAKALIKEEIFIDRELHHYRFSPHETFTVSSLRPPLETVPTMKRYRWVKWLSFMTLILGSVECV